MGNYKPSIKCYSIAEFYTLGILIHLIHKCDTRPATEKFVTEIDAILAILFSNIPVLETDDLPEVIRPLVDKIKDHYLTARMAIEISDKILNQLAQQAEEVKQALQKSE